MKAKVWNGLTLEDWVFGVLLKDHSTGQETIDAVMDVLETLIEPKEDSDAVFTALNGERTRRQAAAAREASRG